VGRTLLKERSRSSRRARPPEEFVRGDPFVENGVVGKATFRDWNEILR
jgi:hypothetical protein